MTDSNDRYRIGVLADTHGHLPAGVFRIFEGVQLILHAGDVGMDSLLIELQALAPVRAVSGNVDGVPDGGSRPLFQKLETPAGRIAMTHGHLRSRMVSHFAAFKPDIIVYGHTHIAYLGQCAGVTLFNPGAAGRAGVGRPPSVGLITRDKPDQPPRLEHVILE
jgi:hypothetical protein